MVEKNPLFPRRGEEEEDKIMESFNQNNHSSDSV